MSLVQELREWHDPAVGATLSNRAADRIAQIEARLSRIGSITDVRAIWRIAAGLEDATPSSTERKDERND